MARLKYLMVVLCLLCATAWAGAPTSAEEWRSAMVVAYGGDAISSIDDCVMGGTLYLPGEDGREDSYNYRVMLKGSKVRQEVYERGPAARLKAVSVFDERGGWVYYPGQPVASLPLGQVYNRTFYVNPAISLIPYVRSQCLTGGCLQLRGDRALRIIQPDNNPVHIEYRSRQDRVFDVVFDEEYDLIRELTYRERAQSLSDRALAYNVRFDGYETVSVTDQLAVLVPMAVENRFRGAVLERFVFDSEQITFNNNVHNDLFLPPVFITMPRGQSTGRGQSPLRVQAFAAGGCRTPSCDAREPVQGVEFYLDAMTPANRIGLATGACRCRPRPDSPEIVCPDTYCVDWRPENVPDGLHRLIARVIYQGGDAIESEPVLVTIAN